MDSQDFKKKILKLLVIFGGLIVFILGYDKVKTIFGFVTDAFMPFLIGGFFALILNIPVRFFETKVFKGSGKIIKLLKRPLSITLSLLVFLGLITGIGFVVVPELSEAVMEMSTSIPEAVSSGITFIKQHITLKEEWLDALNELQAASVSWGGLIEYVATLIPNMPIQLNSAITAIGDVFGYLVNALIAFIFCIYALSEKEKILLFCKKLSITFFPENVHRELFHFLKTLHGSFEDFIYGQCLECFLVALIFTITASIMGFKCSIIVGIIMFFLAFIPYVGNFVSCGIGVLLTLAMESPSRAVIICILFCIIQALDGYFLYPRVIGLKVKMPPLLIFITAIAGGNLFGVVGMFISIPIVTAVYTLITEHIARVNKPLPAKSSERLYDTPNKSVPKPQPKQAPKRNQKRK